MNDLHKGFQCDVMKVSKYLQYCKLPICCLIHQDQLLLFSDYKITEFLNQQNDQPLQKNSFDRRCLLSDPALHRHAIEILFRHSGGCEIFWLDTRDLIPSVFYLSDIGVDQISLEHFSYCALSNCLGPSLRSFYSGQEVRKRISTVKIRSSHFFV